MIEHRPLISVCICTYRRPELLNELLNAIFNDIEFPGSSEIVVVDNDASGSARCVIGDFVNKKPTLRHFEVPVQNISIARNKAVAEARGRWIAMIDDDERPHPKWLVRLFRRAVEMEADAVFGPVQPRFPQSAPQWIIDGRFFERKRFPSGTPMAPGETRTGNVLLKAEMIKGDTEPFNPEFGLTGGEDSLLFDRLLAEGRRLFWCDEAVVEEFVPAERLSWKWMLKRTYRGGQTFARNLSIRNGPDRSQMMSKSLFLLRSLLISFTSIVMYFSTIPFGKAKCFKWLRILAAQIGKISSLFSFKYQEYRDDLRPSTHR
jgi:succinoglycan biosynthesis protein ExoM